MTGADQMRGGADAATQTPEQVAEQAERQRQLALSRGVQNHPDARADAHDAVA